QADWAVWQLRFDGDVAGIEGPVDIDVARIETLREHAAIPEGEGALSHPVDEQGEQERGRRAGDSSGLQAVPLPAAVGPRRVEDPVVEPVRAPLPELERLRTHPQPAPERRPRHRGADEPLLDLGVLRLERLARGDRPRLV